MFLGIPFHSFLILSRHEFLANNRLQDSWLVDTSNAYIVHSQISSGPSKANTPRPKETKIRRERVHGRSRSTRSSMSRDDEHRKSVAQPVLP